MNAETVYEVALALPGLERLKLYWMLELEFEKDQGESPLDRFVSPSKEEMINYFVELVKSKENWKEVAFNYTLKKRSNS